MVIKGSGYTFSDALDDYLDKSEMCDSAVLDDFRGSVGSSAPVSPLYVGINIRHTVEETLEYIGTFNRLNKDYLSLFLPFLPRSQLHSQSFSQPQGSANSRRHRDPSGSDESELAPTDPERSVVVLGEHEDIALLDHFHVTLYYLGIDKRTPESVRADLERLAGCLEGREPGFRQMLNTLTLYEFAVCLMYRHLYRMPFPFERACPEESRENDELAFFRYLVLVPGVVLFAVAELKKPLLALPPKDSAVPDPGQRPGDQVELEALLKSLRDSVLIEAEHSTHVTLGTSRDYKPVISNQICSSLRHFLESGCAGRVHTYSQLKAAGEGAAACSPSPEELRSHLKVFNSGPCSYDNLTEVFVDAVPYLLTQGPGGCAHSGRSAPLRPAPPQPSPGPRDPELYADTRLYVSDDYRWFYFSGLPASHSLHPRPGRQGFDWLIDVYVLSFVKQVQGHIHFNQK